MAEFVALIKKRVLVSAVDLAPPELVAAASDRRYEGAALIQLEARKPNYGDLCNSGLVACPDGE